MSKEHWNVNFGPTTRLREVKTLRLHVGNISPEIHPEADFNFVEVLLGAGVIATSAGERKVVRGDGLSIRHGATYRLHATGDDDLLVQIYEVDGDPTQVTTSTD